MSEPDPKIAAEVHAVCLAAADEAAGALDRAFGGSFAVTVGEAGKYSADATADSFAGPGLVLLLKFGDSAMAAVLPAASELVPPWCADPDATAASKLETLAHELCLLFATAPPAAGESRAEHVEDIAAALGRAGVAADATMMPLKVTSDDKTGQLSLIWPLETPAELYAGAASRDETSLTAAQIHAALEQTSGPKGPTPKVRDLAQLPGYSRSLLKIRVPVSVQLATKKELVQEVISLAPGSIIKFEKGCDELLQMIVGEHAVAEGEAVKIGEKFGFRVISMMMPREHFVPAKRTRLA